MHDGSYTKPEDDQTPTCPLVTKVHNEARRGTAADG